MTDNQPPTVDRGVVVPREALGDVERRVIDRLVDSDMAFSFGAMEAELQDHDGKGPSVDLIGAACRMLAARGLAVHRRGLFNEDGDVYGSGYAATDLARAGLAAPVQPPALAVPHEAEFAGWQRRMRNVNAAEGHPWADWSSWKECSRAQAQECLTSDGRLEGFPELRTEVRKVYAAPAARAFLANLEPSQ